MTRPSLIKRIENYAKARPEAWVSGGEYEKLSIQAGYKGSHADRRCRDLVAAGKLDKEMRNGHIWYRYVPEEEQVRREKILEEVLKHTGYLNQPSKVMGSKQPSLI